MLRIESTLGALLLLAPLTGYGQQTVDLNLAREIAAIPAIDNHAHPVLAPPLDGTDRDFDALPVDNMEPQTDPLAWRPDNPQLAEAWKALFSFSGTPPLDAGAMARLESARAQRKQEQRTNYPQWVLDQSNIRTMLANRVAMGTGVEPPRFRWVPYADALLFPLDNTSLASATPDRKQFFALEDKLRARYLKEVHLSVAPATLDAYLEQVVTPTLERQHTGGAVAEKFELAYLRTFDITAPSRAQADAIYRRGRVSGAASDGDYKLLQDFLFRYIAGECGRLGMAVHLHAMSGGGSYFSISGANPLLLEAVFNDPALRKTSFVLLHGGWPFVHEAGALLQKPNVYLDISQQALTMSPHTMSTWLREWLELYPEKVLFGTDGYPFTTSLGWEEANWIANRNARQSLGLALSGMLADHEITPVRAGELARMVLEGNARSLYRF